MNFIRGQCEICDCSKFDKKEHNHLCKCGHGDVWHKRVIIKCRLCQKQEKNICTKCMICNTCIECISKYPIAEIV